MNEIKLFRLEIKGTTVAEFGFQPNLGTALKVALVSGVALGIGLGAKYAVDVVEDFLRPQYIVSNLSTPQYDEVSEWQRPTDWKRK